VASRLLLTQLLRNRQATA